MKFAWALSVAAALGALAGAALSQEPSATKPILIAKGRDYLVHGIVYPFHDDQARFRSRSWGGCALLCTTPSTGEMKALISTGTVENPTERISFNQTRLLGATADAERLYAVVWSSGRMFDSPPHPGQPFKGGSYSLQVFWLADGTSLGETSLVREPGKSPVSRPNAIAPELPAIAPRETLEKGPLKLTEKGVALYGAAFEFDGRKVAKQEAVPGDKPRE